MCGIAGFVSPGGLTPDTAEAMVRNMVATLAHRGPDAEGVWTDGDGGAALGHRRLAVIDPASGRQPMVGASGCVIVFNGEIYNYRELRADLTAQGCRFRSDSDTEVLLAAYERHGPGVLERLIGMFAFAVWHPVERRLFLARDRLGKKPLFHFQGEGHFAFASEMKALLDLDVVRRQVDIDPLALSDFLSLGYILTPRSIFRGIRKLPAGHCGWYDVTTGEFRPQAYWRLEDHVTGPRQPYDAAARRRFADLVEDAVALRLRADVPLGGYLSGGIDSATVMAMAARRATKPVQAYCVGFADRRFDEYAQALDTADHLNLPMTRLSHETFHQDELPRLVWHCDEPFADTSMIPTYLLNRAARQFTTVALTGDGADECLGGYSTYRADLLHRVYRRVPGALHDLIHAVARKLLRPSHGKVSLDYKARQFLGSHGLSPRRAHYWWRVLFSDEEKRRILGPDSLAACGDYDPFQMFDAHFDRVASASFLDQALYVDVKTWLQDDILVKADRMSMASGVEVRSPFLDHRLVEFLARLEPRAKMAGWTQKRILKQSMAGVLPSSVLGRPKRGFNAPTVHYGFRSLTCGDFPGLLRNDLVLDPAAEDITFKSFSLGVLDIWLAMFSRYRRGEPWGLHA
ncbi:MAG: asparagine synthase (glutamine-hydrolyzing) [Alphaproteobacteria bacterium]